ncbi:MAG: hypothetical protein EBY39_13730, partial [Flavobacteriia bacterium]|nr:hypothetical protein [Flavobacteriia bacterium]
TTECTNFTSSSEDSNGNIVFNSTDFNSSDPTLSNFTVAGVELEIVNVSPGGDVTYSDVPDGFLNEPPKFYGDGTVTVTPTSYGSYMYRMCVTYTYCTDGDCDPPEPEVSGDPHIVTFEGKRYLL